MLEYLGYKSMDAFLKDCVPEEIRLEENAIRDEGAGGIWALSEGELLRRAKELGKKNTVTRSFIGLGYHQAVSFHASQISPFRPVSFAKLLSFLQVLPQVILRNMVENHGWFSQYSPYQVS